LILVSNNLVELLTGAIRRAQDSGDLPQFECPPVKVNRSSKPEHGDYSSPVAMQLAQLSRKKPDEVAEVLVKHLAAPEYLSDISRVGGFVNFRLSSSWLQKQVEAIIHEGDKFGSSDRFSGKRAQVECVSANPTGPITVGRIRGGVIGDTLRRVLQATGYKVELEYYYNDAGAQIDKLGASLRARYLESNNIAAELPDGGYKGDYVVDLASELAAEVGDSLIDVVSLDEFKTFAVKRISEQQARSLERIGIKFDNYFSEQSLYRDGSIEKTLKLLESAGLVYKANKAEQNDDASNQPDDDDSDATASGEATFIRMMKLRGTSKDAVLVKSSGEPTYRLPDIAYHINKLERGFDLAVNILGADHIEEAKDVKAAVGALGYDAERIRVVLHQFVTLKRFEEIVRMRTREGEFVTLDELIDQTSADAVRYFMLARSPESHVDFDLELAKKQSNENPVYYIQNAYVRCIGIERVANEHGIDGSDGDVSLLSDEKELALIRKLIELTEIADQAATELAPHRIAFWAHEELARTFHPIYDEIRAVHSEVSLPVAKARLRLYAAAKIVLKNVLSMMGMSAPEKM
jgi:arginyl-tRNA synthetase